jgi:MFS family permease
MHFLSWLTGAPREARRALLAASLGWMLDAFDVMLYALVLASLMTDFGLSKATAGLLGSLTLVASAAGGVAFGVVADRYGRTRALMASILVYSVFTAACGMAQTLTQLAVFRFLLGLGMGGEWASGAALVSETWPDRDRGKAMGVMQSSWAIGYAAAALVTGLVLPRFGWRAVFFTGLLPALLTFWVRRHVEEPALWRRAATAPRPSVARIFEPPFLRVTVALTLMNACTMFAYWGFNLWVPAYFALSPARGGVGLTSAGMSSLVALMQVGTWLGYVAFGFASDAFGRKRTYVAYLVAAAGLLAAFTLTRSAAVLIVLGPMAAFFGAGYFSGFGAVSAELFPTAIRASAQGLTYNAGRLASAVAPLLVGSLADARGFGVAFTTATVAFLAAALFWAWIPETRGRSLT